MTCLLTPWKPDSKGLPFPLLAELSWGWSGCQRGACWNHTGTCTNCCLWGSGTSGQNSPLAKNFGEKNAEEELLWGTALSRGEESGESRPQRACSEKDINSQGLRVGASLMQAESQTPRTDAAALCDRGSFRSDEIVLDLTGGAIVQHEYTKNHRIVYWKMTTTPNFITV